MIKTKAYAALTEVTAHTPNALVVYDFERREPGAHDIVIKIHYCGICHSDIHKVRNEWASWSPTTYPIVPGHEIVGVVERIGLDVKKFKVGDLAGVGCMVNTCRTCGNCAANEEQFCEQGVTFTYNSPDPHGPGIMTYGGYSDRIVVNEDFGLHVPSNLDLAAVAPLLCAGITTYSPLKRWLKKGQRVGILGLGGLGHMAIKLAKAMGGEVTLFTTSSKKYAEGLRLGADHVVIATDPTARMAQANQFHLLIDTISGDHDINAYLGLLKLDGVMVMLGLPEKDLALKVARLAAPRRILTASLIGGILETQEMLDFCAVHNIVSDIELIAIQDVNIAYERVLKHDVKYRFVIDMSTLV